MGAEQKPFDAVRVLREHLESAPAFAEDDEALNEAASARDELMLDATKAQAVAQAADADFARVLSRLLRKHRAVIRAAQQAHEKGEPAPGA